jgi:hypothetical protein
VASNPVDLGTPGGRSVWLDRSPPRRVSDPANGPGALAIWAPRVGHLLARPEDAPRAALPAQAAHDLGVHQVWCCLPEDTKHAFGSQFSQIVVRVLRGIRTWEVDV